VKQALQNSQSDYISSASGGKNRQHKRKKSSKSGGQAGRPKSAIETTGAPPFSAQTNLIQRRAVGQVHAGVRGLHESVIAQSKRRKHRMN
jgi:hypothetical protein